MNTRPPVSEIVHMAVMLMQNDMTVGDEAAIDRAIGLYDTAETRLNAFFDAQQQQQQNRPVATTRERTS
jgi:hypothetical protein